MTNPVFGLPHLSEDAVAAFADGVLSAAAASRAQRHCAECVECADAVRGQRETAMMLRTSQAPPLPSGLLDRLAGLPMSTPLPPSRGLPTVLGADGTPMFVAHDRRKADEAGSGEQRQTGVQHSAQPPARQLHRRGALPVTLLASAAAVVAAGAFSGQVSTLAAAVDRQTPAGAANVAGSLTGGRSVAPRVLSPLSDPGTPLTGSRPSAGPTSSSAGPTSTPTDQTTRPTPLLGSQLATSVVLAPVLRGVQQPRAAASGSSAATTKSSARSSARSSDRSSARPAGEQHPAGSTPPRAGKPMATP